MNWINGFELMCYILSALLIADMCRKKNISEGKIFLSGCIAGFALELLAVRVTGIYHYNPRFWLNLGAKPYQFPVFGGLMWGGLTVCGLRLAERLQLSKAGTALTTGFLIVSMDLLLDVSAIRLDGGFWVWEGRAVTLDITHHMFMSVIWVNFLGYLFETPMVTLLSLRDREKAGTRPIWKHLLSAVLIALAGIGFVGIMSLLSLWLNSITDEWFACAAFLLLWGYILFLIIKQIFSGKLRCSFKKPYPLTAGLFFLCMYAYCFIGLGTLGVFREKPWFSVLGALLAAGTLLLGTLHPTDENRKRGE